MVGPTGESYWKFVSGNIYYNPSTNNGVGIGTSSPATTVDISGSLTVRNQLFVNKINETITTVTASASNTFTLNYNQGAIFYLSTSSTANMTFNIINLPSTTDSTRSYVLTTIFNGNGFYGNSITLNGGSSIVPNFSSTPSVSSNFQCVQSIAYLYANSTGFILSNVTSYNS
jgi:hypothetical protein